MAKKNKEPIVLNKTELMPTNLGSMKQKESGLITTIVILILFAGGILFLPKIMEMFNPIESPPIPYVPTEQETPSEKPDEQIAGQTIYYDLSDSLEIDIQGFVFSNFVIKDGKAVFTIERRTGNANYFEKHPYYIEYYSKSEELLGRSKIEEKEISSKSEESYEISNVSNVSTIAKITIREIIENEYPMVNPTNDSSGNPVLTCSNGKESITYTFQKSTSKYALKKIESTKAYENTLENYEELLDEYTTLADSLKNTKGVEASLIPVLKGFEFVLDVNLEEISASDLSKLLKEKYYYKENTDAKVISFEMQSANYLCK